MNNGHSPRVMMRVTHSEHYSNKNWSCRFECPECKKSVRQNTNFLGRRDLCCNGLKVRKTAKGFHLVEIE